MYTGGTTGLARGALIENRAEMLNLYHIGIAVEMSDRRVYLHQTPMFHAASMGGVIGIPAMGGTSVFGGRGSIWGTFIGSFMIGGITAGIVAVGLTDYYTSLIYGAVILVSVTIHAMLQRRFER